MDLPLVDPKVEIQPKLCKEDATLEPTLPVIYSQFSH